MMMITASVSGLLEWPPAYAILLGPPPPTEPIDWEKLAGLAWSRMGWFLLDTALACYAISRSVTIIARRRTHKPGMMAFTELAILWGACAIVVVLLLTGRGVGIPEVLAGFFLLIGLFLVLRYVMFSTSQPRWRQKK